MQDSDFRSKVLQGAVIGGAGALILSAVAWYAAFKTGAVEVAIAPLMVAGVLGGATGSAVVQLIRAGLMRRQARSETSSTEDPGLTVFLLSLGFLTLIAGVAGALPFVARWVPMGQKEASPLWSVPLGAAIGLFASGIWSALRQLEVGRKD